MIAYKLEAHTAGPETGRHTYEIGHCDALCNLLEISETDETQTSKLAVFPRSTCFSSEIHKNEKKVETYISRPENEVTVLTNAESKEAQDI
ncbi:hypothetical protein VNO77_14153 [Canavalia gladiata]|uniref:Uncharacterized protein n=1 Tax=Canavalia gladiata TaxID=3824 RepID=A0AAN9QVB2_CANGL